MESDFVVPIGPPVANEVFAVAEAAELGRRIKDSEQKTAAHFLETARLCNVAFQKYRTRGLPVLLRAAQMSKSRFMKFVAIADNPRLRQIEKLLPPRFTSIHQICQLTDEQFDEAVKAEFIHPGVRRSEIEALRKQSSGKNKQTNDLELPGAVSEIAAGGRYEFIVPIDIGADQCAQIKKTFAALCRKFSVDIVSIKELDASETAASQTTHRIGQFTREPR